MTSPDPHNRPEFLAGHATVAEASALLPTEPLSVSLDTKVAELAQRLAQRPQVRTIAVIDDSNHLLGIIPLTRLVDDLFLRVAPEVFLRHVLDPVTGADDIRAHTAQTAHELMQEPLFVLNSTTIRDAFALMREHHIESVPIVDEEHRVVGQLDLIELLLLWLRTLQAHLTSP